jgi:hypothetical protein
MPEPKTRRTTASVKDFVAALPNEQRRKDATAVVKLMAEVTGEKAAMWGPSIVGFGSFRGPTADWPIAAFAPRKTGLVVYLIPDFADRYGELLERLGPHGTGKSCLYVKRLADIDAKVLRRLVEKSVADALRLEDAQKRSTPA